MNKTLFKISRTLPGRLVRVIYSALVISAQRSGGNPLVLASELRKIARIFLDHRFWPHDARRWGLLDKTGDITEGVVSKQRLVSYQDYLNHPSFHCLVEDKALFNNYCQRMGLPAPELYGVFFKKASGWSALGQQGTIATHADFVAFVKQCPDYFVVKPTNGVYGRGIQFIDKVDPEFSADSLYQSLKSQSFGGYVFQQAMANHADIMAINPKKGLQTLRIATFIDRNMDVIVVQSSFKLIVGDLLIDNHTNGATGNLLSQVDVESGILSTPVLMTPTGIVKIEKHPETGRELAGLQLPQWKEACDLVRDAAMQFLPMRSIGWDVALTDQGPVLIEGNVHWDPPKHGKFGLDNPFFSEMTCQ